LIASWVFYFLPNKPKTTENLESFFFFFCFKIL
ncbi:unnamed protein product, partial [Staurois parvus]